MTTQYDSQGRQVAVTDQLGNVTRYEYDDLGRLAAVILPAVEHPDAGIGMVHPRYEYEYDRYGNQPVIRDNVYQTDPLDPASIVATDARETHFTYDHEGRQLTRTLPDGLDEESFYNFLGQLERSVDFEGRVTTYEYDNTAGAGGRLTTTHFGNSVVIFAPLPLTSQSRSLAPAQVQRPTLVGGASAHVRNN